MTAKTRLRGLVETLSEPEAELAVEALTALTADLPPVDAVAVSRQSREALEGRLAD